MPLASLAGILASLAEASPDLAPLNTPDPYKRLDGFNKLKSTAPLDQLLPRIADLARHSDPGVRLALARALRGVDIYQAQPLLADVAAGYQPGETEYLDDFANSVSGNEEAVYAYLLGKIGGPPLKWSEPFADIASRLHPVDALFAFKDRAMAAPIPADRRQQAIEAIAQISDKLAAAAMAEIAAKGPEDLRHVAKGILRSNRRWQDSSRPEVGIKLPEKPRFKSEILRTGSVEIDVDITGAKKLFLVATDGGNGNSCDWADWIEPVLVSSAGATRLTELKWAASHNGWGQLNINKNCHAMPLKVGGKVYENGIGGHAPVVLAYDIAGKGYTRFKARAGVDNGAPDLGGSDYVPATASLQFFVYAE